MPVSLRQLAIGLIALASIALCAFYFMRVETSTTPNRELPPRRNHDSHNANNTSTNTVAKPVFHTPTGKPTLVIALEVFSEEQFSAVRDTWLSSYWNRVVASAAAAEPTYALLLFARSDVMKKLSASIPKEQLAASSAVAGGIHLLESNSKSKVEATAQLWYELNGRFPNAAWYYVTSTRNQVYTRYLMEHIDKLVARGHTASKNAAISGRVVEYTPTATPFVILRSGYLLNNIGLVAGLRRFTQCTFTPRKVPNFEADIAISGCLQQPMGSPSTNETELLYPTVAVVDHLGIHPDKPEKCSMQDCGAINMFPEGVKYTPVEPASFSYLMPTSLYNIEPARMRLTHDFQYDYFFDVPATLQAIGHKDTPVENIPLQELRKHFPMPTLSKNLHQIWVGPKKAPRPMETCKEVNKGWNYILWNENRVANLKRLINKRMLDTAPELLMRTDMYRVEILFQFGGIYLDADSVCLRPFDTLVDDFDRRNYNTLLQPSAPRHNEGFLAYESEQHRPNLIANGAFGSTPYGLATLHILRMFATTALNDAPWISTGPMFVTRVLTQSNLNYHVWPSSVFFPVHYVDHNALGRNPEDIARVAREKNAYTNQLWGSTFGIY